MARFISSVILMTVCWFFSPAYAGENQPGMEKTAALMNQLEQRLIEGLSQQGVQGNLRIELIGDQQEIFKSFYYGEAKLQQVHVTNINANNGYFSAQAEILPHSLGQSVTLALQGQYEDIIRIPVLRSKAVKGDIIKTEDITLLEKPSRLVRGDVITKTEALVGKMAKRGISPGQAISARVISEPVLIKKGRHVTLVYDTPSIRLRTIGVALEEGEQGALIPVKNISSGVVVHAEVSGQNEARIPVIGEENTDDY